MEKWRFTSTFLNQPLCRPRDYTWIIFQRGTSVSPRHFYLGKKLIYNSLTERTSYQELFCWKEAFPFQDNRQDGFGSHARRTDHSKFETLPLQNTKYCRHRRRPFSLKAMHTFKGFQSFVSDLDKEHFRIKITSMAHLQKLPKCQVPFICILANQGVQFVSIIHPYFFHFSSQSQFMQNKLFI